MNPFKVRILQGHFAGTLHIRRSKVYDFAVEDHEELMKIMICWLRSTPHGDAMLSTQMPIFRHDVHDDEDIERTIEDENENGVKVDQGVEDIPPES